MKEEVNDELFGECGPSQTLCEALEGNHTSALIMWKRVADGKWEDIEVRLWCEEIARRLLDVDRPTDSKRRPDAIVKAVGLAGKKKNPNCEQIDEICFLHMAFKNLDEEERPGDMVRTILEELKAKNLNIRTDDEDTKKYIYQRISEVRKKNKDIL